MRSLTAVTTAAILLTTATSAAAVTISNAPSAAETSTAHRPTNFGEYRPNVHTAGLPAGLHLGYLDGSEDGVADGVLKIDTTRHPELAHIDAKEIKARIEVVRGDVSITRSRITVPGGAPHHDAAVVWLKHDHAHRGSLKISDSTLQWGEGLSWGNPNSAKTVGLKGANIDAQRVHIRHVTDGVNIDGGNFSLQGSLVNDGHQSVDPRQKSDGIAHADAIQISAGNNIVIRGNDLNNYVMSAIMIVPQKGLTDTNITNITIENNWLDHGSCTINMYAKPDRVISGVTLRNNTFGPHQKPVKNVQGKTQNSACAGKTGRHGTMTNVSHYVVSGNTYTDHSGEVRGTAYLRDYTNKRNAS